MHFGAQPIGDPITLPLHCLECHGAISVTYQQQLSLTGRRNTENTYVCPHCHKEIRILLPGVITAIAVRHVPQS